MKIVYLPFEEAGREYLSRLWMANAFRKYGLTSVVLPKYYMDRLLIDNVRWPIGAVIHKGANRVSSILTLDFQGHINVVIDEETLNVVDEDFIKNSMSDVHLQHTRIFMASHSAQESALQGKLPMGHIVQGLNPRLEMLRSPIVRDALPAAVEGRVLINTNVGALNSTLPSLGHYAGMLEQVGLCTSDTREAFTYEHYEHDNMKQHAFYAAIASMKDTAYVRTHPGESNEHWKKFCAALDVPMSDHSLTHLEEIASAETVLGYRCTTLIEAGFLGKDTFDIAKGEHKWDSYYMQHPFSELYPQSGLDYLGAYFQANLHDHSGKNPHKAVLERSWNVHKDLTERQKNKLKFPDELSRKVLKNMGLDRVKRKNNTVVVYP